MVPLTVAVLIACQLGVFSAEERRRYEMVRAQIHADITRIVEVENGYVFHLPDDDATLTTLAEWIALERRCCPFFEFTVSVGGSEPSILVALTGSPEVKQFLESEFGSRVVSPGTLVRQR